MREDKATLLKFTPPSLPAGFLYRPRLGQALARGISGKLTLLVAPAGYGKTSLLASMAAEWDRFSEGSTATSLCWYSLDPSDDDAATFVDGMVESVRQVAPGFGRTVRAALRGTPDARREIRELVSMLLDELREAPCGKLAIVLDGLHSIADRAIVDALEEHLLDPAAPLRLIISARADPRLYLSPLRSRDALVELGEDDLRFTPDETRELLLVRLGRLLPQGLVDELVRETGGWPSAVNLAALLLERGREVLPSRRRAPTEHGYALLVGEVLAGLPPRQRDLVLRTSLLRWVDAESCRDALGVDDADAVPSLLEDAALPIVRPANRGEPLCFEPLFRSALERHLSQQLLPHEYQRLARRVAAFHAARGEWDEAIRRFLEAGADEDAAAAIEKAIDAELDMGHLDTAIGWIRALPTPVLRRHPRLMVQDARLLLARGRLEDARALLVAALPELEATKDRVGIGQLLGAWSAVHLQEGRYRDAWRSAEGALERLSEGEAAEAAEVLWLLARCLELMGDLGSAHYVASRGLLMAGRSGGQKLVVRAMLQVSHLAYLRGDYAESLALSGRAVQRSALMDTEILALCAAGGTAALAYLERGQVQEAAVVAARALEASQWRRDNAARVRSGVALAAASERLGQGEFSEDRVAEAVALSARLPSHWPERTAALQLQAAFLLRRRRRKEGMESAREAMQAALDTSHRVLIDQCRLVVAASEMAGLRMPLVLLRIRQLCSALKRSDSRRWLSAGLQLMALACWRLGLRWLARGSLRRSLELAAKGSYVGMPPGLPSDTRRLLALAVLEGVAPELAGSLLGVEPTEGMDVLAPFLSHGKPDVRGRAEQAAKGIEAGAGRPPQPRLIWPGLAEEGGDPRREVVLLTLGGLDAYVDGQPVEWPSIDARNLAAYLVVRRNHPTPMEAALRDLWPGHEASAAYLRLQVAIYQVREALGAGYPAVDPLLESQGKLLWEGAGCSIDMDAFRESLDRVQRELKPERLPALPDLAVSLLEDAVGLYKGAFLASVDFPWCRAEREDLRAQLLWATRLLVSHYMDQGNWQEAIRHGRKSLRIDPLQEDVVRDLMVCHWRLGDRGGTLRLYREVKMHLARVRGVWPSRETRELRLQLLGR